jgi:hypothetical protein
MQAAFPNRFETGDQRAALTDRTHGNKKRRAQCFS